MDGIMDDSDAEAAPLAPRSDANSKAAGLGPGSSPPVAVQTAQRGVERPQASADNTRRAYASDWKHFAAWCRRNGVAIMPPRPETVGSYLAALATGGAGAERKMASIATLKRRLSALAWNYGQRGLILDRSDGRIADALTAARKLGSRPAPGKQALRPDELVAMLETLDRATLRGLRDRAILLLGFAGGLRRSEIVGLDCGPDESENGSGWVDIRSDGMLVALRSRRGKREIAIARSASESSCPVAAVESWMKYARLAHGPLFRRVTGKGRSAGSVRLNDRHVARLVKQAALAAGIRPELSAGARGEMFSSHSLRAGSASFQEP
ncbi:tyrosine-type recombinase/integrase [Rhizobiaceae bacterium n13]|uniref:Tyrosine-type recombinase/integrase n=1 Tax=Ferirhizobium litorale TaxID=2927786 RepID=A0AAE3QG83_9HYPH|nr:tyrosine-type recombinase/integrase [Fererhizobium litorale]MDI7861937.1 tyrosine-type recombinase/integrase [Fererhizobium litorale]MDI7922791.1 tyrosine-type recombinase/integrase [Fererhizobium litorale]